MPAPHTWFVLLHRPGPAVPEGTSVFDHPGIRDHYEFLHRRAADRTLVAAGPLTDEDGDGLTVLASRPSKRLSASPARTTAA